MEINLFYGTCWICGSKANSLSVPRGYDYSHLRCEQCGEFKISASAVAAVSQYKSPEEVIKLSGWVLYQNRENGPPTLFSHMLKDIANMAIPGPEERLSSLLMEISACQSEFGVELNITEEPRCYAATFIPRGDHKGERAIIGLAHILEDEGFVKLPPQSRPGTVRLTLAGYKETERLRARRTETRPTPVGPQPPKTLPETSLKQSGVSQKNDRQYQVALSYAGEQREYVEEVAQQLKDRGISVFFDGFEKSTLWGTSAAEAFHKVFAEQSVYVVMFISRDHSEKEWPRHERRATFSRMIKERREYVLPVRFDDTKIDGLPDDVIYQNANEITPDQLAAMIHKKLGEPSVTDPQPPEPKMILNWMGEVVNDPRFRGWIKLTHWGNDTHPRPPQKGDTVTLAGTSGLPETITEAVKSALGGWKVNTNFS